MQRTLELVNRRENNNMRTNSFEIFEMKQSTPYFVFYRDIPMKMDITNQLAQEMQNLLNCLVDFIKKFTQLKQQQGTQMDPSGGTKGET